MALCKASTMKAAPSKPQKSSKSFKLARQAKPEIQRKNSIPLKGRKAIFLGKIFVLCREFPNSHNMMEGWITHHGGRVDKVVTNETTLLVCTMDNFKNKVSKVQEAGRLGKSKCKIVDWEFIEDSILPKPRHLSESTYQLEKILAGKKRKIAPVARQKKNAVKDSEGCKGVIEPVQSRSTSDNISSQGKEVEERFTIYLFESDPLPPTYCLATSCLAKKYKNTDVVAVFHHDDGVGREFQKAYAEFKSIFEEKTGMDWDQRLEKSEQKEGSYTYMPPSGRSL